MVDEVHVHQTPPPAGDGGGGGTNVLLVVVVLLLVGLIAWFMFMRGGDAGGDGGTEVNIEAPKIETPDVNVDVTPAAK
jgi:hypothetical protein